MPCQLLRNDVPAISLGHGRDRELVLIIRCVPLPFGDAVRESCYARRESREEPMSGPRIVATALGVLRRFMATALCAGMLAIAFSCAGVCQTPGYGEKPDQWAPYERGKYFDQLGKLASTYRLSEGKIFYLHFEIEDGWVGPVELFRIPMTKDQDCHESDCFLFALFASDHDEAPLVTTCQFSRARLVDLYTPDGLDVFGFEFSCLDTVLQLHVTPTHFMAVPYRP